MVDSFADMTYSLHKLCATWISWWCCCCRCRSSSCTSSCCCCRCRESQWRTVSQSFAWNFCSTSCTLHRPNGVVYSSVYTHWLWEGNVEGSGVIILSYGVYFYCNVKITKPVQFLSVKRLKVIGHM